MGDVSGTTSDSSRAALLLVLIAGGAFALGLLLGIDGFNGPWYWRWPWRQPASAWPILLLAIPLPAIMAALRKPVLESRRDLRGRWLLLVVASFALQMFGMLSYPESIDRLHALVASPVATSYFTDAAKIDDLSHWLRHFHTAQLELHSSTHPPGPIVFYYAWLKLLGPVHGALGGAMAIGLWAAFGVFAMWSFAGLWTERVDERLTACALYTLLPALIVFFPEFDQVYPIFAMLMALAWVRALQGVRGAAIGLAVVLFLASLFAYNLLALGAFMAIHAVWFAVEHRGSREAIGRLCTAAGVALAGFAALHGLTWLATGYDPIRSFEHALAVQAQHAALLDRPWVGCVVFDLYDFLLGSGMIAAPLILVFLLGRGIDERSHAVALTWIGLATILVVDLSGLLRAETARVWLFLQPFVIVPAAIALSRFGTHERQAIVLMQWFIAAVLASRLSFISP